MNTGNHVVKNKKVYNLKFLDKRFRAFLEEKSFRKLTKIRLLQDVPGLARWNLEGIKDVNYGNYKIGGLFEELRPVFHELFGEEIIQVGRAFDRSLILDLRRKEDLFQSFTDEQWDKALQAKFPGGIRLRDYEPRGVTQFYPF